MKKIYLIATVFLSSAIMTAQTVIYSNNFEAGVNDATIVGTGQIINDSDSNFGKVFHNAANGQVIRSNYLLLPNDLFASFNGSGHDELTISFWVNIGTATNYWFLPLFTAYGSAPDYSDAAFPDGKNTWPMLALQSRLIGQVNCAGYTDLAETDNDLGSNTETTSWLDDENWHFYTATYTSSSVKIYVDGNLQNSWTLDGTDGHSVNGIFTNGYKLDYVCLGGNQAWDWADEDPAYLFDDVTIYADALSEVQINTLISQKMNTSSVNEIDRMSNSFLKEEIYFNLNGQMVDEDFESLKPGIYLKSTKFEDGTSRTEKIIKTKK